MIAENCMEFNSIDLWYCDRANKFLDVSCGLFARYFPHTMALGIVDFILDGKADDLKDTLSALDLADRSKVVDYMFPGDHEYEHATPLILVTLMERPDESDAFAVALILIKAGANIFAQSPKYGTFINMALKLSEGNDLR